MSEHKPAIDLKAEDDLTLIFERDDVYDAFSEHCCHTHLDAEVVRQCESCRRLRLVLANAIVEWLALVDQDRVARRYTFSAGVSAHDPDRERSDSHRGDSSKPCSTVAADRDPEVATPDAARLRQIRERVELCITNEVWQFNKAREFLNASAYGDITFLLARLDAQDSELRTLRADQEDLRRWRSWAQFVWKGGGPISGTDDELRKAICEQFDELRAASPAPQEPQG